MTIDQANKRAQDRAAKLDRDAVVRRNQERARRAERRVRRLESLLRAREESRLLHLRRACWRLLSRRVDALDAAWALGVPVEETIERAREWATAHGHEWPPGGGG